MKAKYFNGKEKVKESVIDEIAEGIIEGRSVVFPTETVYGIGANANNEQACARIFDAKERPNSKPLIVLISDVEMLHNIANITSQIELKLIERFWPGPLTLVLNGKEGGNIANIVTAGKLKIGVRMTSGEIARRLLQKAKVPIVAPSANLSGRPTGTKIENIIEALGDKVDYILDCGDIQTSTTSTVVEVRDNVICVLREGIITVKALSEVAEVKIISE